MVIWSGHGYLAAVFIFVCSLIANLITNHLTSSENFWDENSWPFGIAMIIAAPLCWFAGKMLYKSGSKTLIDPETNKEIIINPSHTLFFIPLHYWGVLCIIFSIISFIKELIKRTTI